MFQTFTGNSRRPRQVNLSGRNPNPFASFGAGGGLGSTNLDKAQTSNHTVASAQAERAQRQLERERQKAALAIQRTWRGYADRLSFSTKLRTQFDEDEGRDGRSHDAYVSGEEALERSVLLLSFVSPRNKKDTARLQRLGRRLGKTSIEYQSNTRWNAVLRRLEAATLRTIEHSPPVERDSLWELLHFFSSKITVRASKDCQFYYETITRLVPVPLENIAAPLQHISQSTLYAYQGLAHFLARPPTGSNITDATRDALAQRVNCKVFAGAIAHCWKENAWPLQHLDVNKPSTNAVQRSWLLAYLIYFYRSAHGFSHSAQYAGEQSLVYAVSSLLASIADEVEIEAPADYADETYSSTTAVDPWVHEQVVSLLTQESIGSIISRIGPDTFTDSSNEMTQILASYILTLLRLFPRRSDEIRMWLYLGSCSTGGQSSNVIRLFWNASRQTRIFQSITQNPRAAVQLLKPQSSRSQESDSEWRVMFIFVELYLFVLKVMDDEEFFGSPSPSSSINAKPNSLPLKDVEEMTTFLKHLGFAMYYHAKEIVDPFEDDKTEDISSLFKVTGPRTSDSRKAKNSNIAGIHGASLDYLKGLVTGLLRAIYERDSRRAFLPQGHWLMVSHFDMTNFIDAVVEEEGRRSQLQEEDDDEEEDEMIIDEPSSAGLVGTGHAQRTQRIQQLQREQKRASRRRYLLAVAPRLEILQNMPFLIPFTTRVQIFRRFIHLDQLKRRHGITDADTWRILMSEHSNDPMNPLHRHQAKIRRSHEFEDAYEQFWELGPALKEPIQITFVDQFDQPEAGIDGGGVTKEFLTSVTAEAFARTDGVQMFVENDQHLLYPNPAAIEEQREYLKAAGRRHAPPGAPDSIGGLLQRYEFLGRIIGKCMYEGILVDIGFAGFFLLKWALTGGAGSAPRESGYRANLNDLRDLDEGLYRGLLQLKNYPGDVAEDFGLNFTVSDTLSVPAYGSTGPKQKTVTKELKPGGTSIAVTNANRLVYISYMARHRLSSQPHQQTMAFLKGLSSIIQPSWLSMFNQSELQTLIGGAPAEIDVADLRRNTLYSGVYAIGDDGQEHESVRHFWDVMHEISDTDRRKVLKFVTSTPRAPLLGFGSLNPQFSIRDAGDDQARLPSTSTCVNLLKLPRFRSKATCKDKLLQAVNSGAGFDLS